jgi:hypothetical protein
VAHTWSRRLTLEEYDGARIHSKEEHRLPGGGSPEFVAAPDAAGTELEQVREKARMVIEGFRPAIGERGVDRLLTAIDEIEVASRARLQAHVLHAIVNDYPSPYGTGPSVLMVAGTIADEEEQPS